MQGAAFPTGPTKADGYLGFGLLRHYVLVFDYPQSQLRLYPSDNDKALARECPGASFDLGIDGNLLTSSIGTELGPLLLAWDTGATANVLRPSAVPTAGQRMRWPWQPRVWTARQAHLGGLDIGPIHFQIVDFKEPAVAGFLGYDFFQAQVVCFDFVRKKVGIGAR